MRVGILELLAASPTTSLTPAVGHYLITKQYASIMPQTVSVWSKQLGHKVFYASYYGQGDPRKLLPDDLDVLFVSCYTQASALGYALAKLYRKDKTLTVIGGPHASSFPRDCLRFFDIVVHQCDKTLIGDILRGNVEPNSSVSSGRPLTDIPSVEERLPEIKASAFCQGRWPYISTTVPLLASVGCPYTCSFCTDWDNPYALMPLDRLEEDLCFLSQRLPGVKISFHDPNFAVRFDQTLDVLERVPGPVRSPYIMESSLSVLRGPRLHRLRETNCIYAAPGIESWSAYSNKAGVGKKTGPQKVELIAEHLDQLHTYVPGIQANFIFGVDTDEGDEPVELTKEFMRRTPFAWPVINIPVPFGGTPLYDEHLEAERILGPMPFTFYYFPYLVTTLNHYDPHTYYHKLNELLTYAATKNMLWHRLRTTPNWSLRLLHTVRTRHAWGGIQKCRQILEMLSADSQFRAFHEGRSATLPEFYHQEFERLLGPYSALLSRADRTPELAPQATATVTA